MLLWYRPQAHPTSLLCAIGLLSTLLPQAEACTDCPGTPFLGPTQLATLGSALISIATINVRGGLFKDTSTTPQKDPDNPS